MTGIPNSIKNNFIIVIRINIIIPKYKLWLILKYKSLPLMKLWEKITFDLQLTSVLFISIWFNKLDITVRYDIILTHVIIVIP